jgi:nicotinamidase/pyrazinamidase
MFVIATVREHGDKLDGIIVSLDSHNPEHIAHARMWKDSNNNHPASFTKITSENIKNHVWIPVAPVTEEYAIRYTAALERSGKFTLVIWPEHCIINTPGHAVFPPLQSAISEWEERRKKQAVRINKVRNIGSVFFCLRDGRVDFH